MIRILHWNILYEEKPGNILKLVKEFDPDIFCCQEINDFNGRLVQKIAKLFKDYYFEPAIIIGANDERLDLGNAIFSKYRLSNQRKVYLQNGPNQTSNNKQEERIYIEVKAKIGDGKLCIGTTHLSFAPYFDSTPDRKIQSKILLKATKDNDKNFLITGDFNAAPKTKIIKDLEKLLVSAGPPHNEPTFSTIPFSFLGFDVTGLDWRVDYIFTTPDVKIISSKIIDTKFSDHLPILVEIEI